MELWDILDENRNKTGRTIERGKQMMQGEYHLVVHVWILNSKGEFLISKRTPNKKYGDLWETTGGSAVSGDDSLTTALKEVKEELGVSLNPNKGKIFKRFKRQDRDFPQFTDVWLFKQEVDINTVVFQPEETNDAMLATKDKINQMIDAGEFIGRGIFFYLDDLFEFCGV